MFGSDPAPPAWRIILAFLIAPGAAALAFACLGAVVTSPPEGAPDTIGWIGIMTYLYALFGAYLPTLVLGVPAFLVLRRWLRPTLLNCALVGAAVAAGPWLLMLPLASLPGYGQIGGQVPAINGRLTLWGWFLQVRWIALVGGMGALGGAMFWVISAARLPTMGRVPS